MKKVLLTIILGLIMTQLWSQKKDSLMKRSYNNIVTVDMKYLINLFTQDHKYNAPTFNFSYFRLINKNMLRFGVAFNINHNKSDKATATDTNTLNFKNDNINFYPGYARLVRIYKRVDFYYGADLVYGVSYIYNDTYTAYKDYSNFIDSRIDQYNYGIMPLFGLMVHLNRRIAIGFENSLSIVYQNHHENTWSKKIQNKTVTITETPSTKSSIITNYNPPATIYLYIKL